MPRGNQPLPNTSLDKFVLDKYMHLPLPDGKIHATYVWIDGTKEHLRCKTRIINFTPKNPSGKNHPSVVHLLIILISTLMQQKSQFGPTMDFQHFKNMIPFLTYIYIQLLCTEIHFLARVTFWCFVKLITSIMTSQQSPIKGKLVWI